MEDPWLMPTRVVIELVKKESDTCQIPLIIPTRVVVELRDPDSDPSPSLSS